MPIAPHRLDPHGRFVFLQGTGAMRIVLVDDSQAFRDRLRLVLDIEPELDVVGETTAGTEAVALARRLRPDLMVIGTDRDGAGMGLLKQIAAECPETQILAIGSEPAGADDQTGAEFIPKRTSLDEFVFHVRRMLSVGTGVLASDRESC